MSKTVYEQALVDIAADDTVVGWDVGGAHLKACVMRAGRLVDVAQWACPLWQGLPQLDAALERAAQRWPGLADALHAVTMTGEMVDCFADREEGVSRIAARLTDHWRRPPAYFAGERGWLDADEVAAHWEHVASANWLATAHHVARFAEGQADGGVLVDIGSTTTDLVPFRAGRVLSHSRNDAQRLAAGELVYQGVVRTPLCALSPRIEWQGGLVNVMNEFFATTADVYRLTAELHAEHDLHPSADGAAKDLPASRQRLARMVGLDARDGSAEDWQAAAQAWRRAQVTELAHNLKRVIAAHHLGSQARVVSAGCGAFLVEDVLTAAQWTRHAPVLDYGSDVVRLSPGASAGLSNWARVCAPSVAVAALYQREHV